MEDAPSVAILGASNNRAKFGNKSVRAHARAGYRVFPVNPFESEIEGFPAFASLRDISAELDRISVYLAPRLSLGLLAQIEEKGAREIWFNPGSADHHVFEEAQRLGLAAIDGCSIVALGLSPAQFP